MELMEIEMLMKNDSRNSDTLVEIYPPAEIPGGISGKWVILGMLVLAVGATAFEWNYMRLHRAPFIPLREAIAESFGRTAKVKIEGGRNKRGPMTLRIVIDVPFDPTAKEEKENALDVLQRLEKLASEKVDLKEYEIMQIYLVQVVPEGTPKRLEHRRPMTDVMNRKQIELKEREKKSPQEFASPLPELQK